MTSSAVQENSDLFTALARLDSANFAERFCIDLLTPAEIEAFQGRWRAAQLLAQGKSQRDVALQANVGLVTVTRVNRFLRRGAGGYREMLRKLGLPSNLK